MNIKKLSSILVLISLAVLFSACGSDEDNYYFENNNNEGDITAYYGDKQQDRVVVLDVNTMTQKTSIYTNGSDPYPVDQAGKLDKLYAITRTSNSIDIIDPKTNELSGLIHLSHFPRSSEAFNTTLGLQLVTGADKPMASLIDVNTDTVVSVVGINTVYPANGDYGGGNATGHPFWFNDSQFALIDRPNRIIHVYSITKDTGGAYVVTEDSTVTTPTTVHHLIKTDNFFYAIAEGAPAIAPTLLKYTLTGATLTEVGSVALSTDPAIIPTMGSHHANMHPDGVHMYIGSTEGNLYVVDTTNMSVASTITVGEGAGHTTFSMHRNLAVITNHKARYVSIINTADHTLIQNVEVSGPQINAGTILQSHTSFCHPNAEGFFYAFATDNGKFYELDLNKLEVTRTVETGGTPLQGVFLCASGDCHAGM